MAEAMLMDKPVIATGYSGNMDFMTEQTAMLIPHAMIDIDETRLVYRKRMRWADPSVDHAAKAMRSILEKPNEAREMAQRAKAHIQRVLSLEAAGKRFLERAKILSEKKQFTKKVA
jgi:glycosyltransferase involved in cell wall biosynthesis